ncbi:MAG: Gfo/Idh/MocA family oxidoreductase [Planctomycetota bacterium]|nr:Gfo/Idh/MocA family oxidoreductase [Planctomycetota bacterium]
MKKIGVGLIGCGDVSERYAEALRDIEAGELVAVMDAQKKVAENFGKEFGVPHTDDLDDVLSDKEIDMVIVAVPHYLHAPITIQAAGAGKHVMCEKPLATTLDDGKRMISECKKAGVKLGVNYALRYHPASTRAGELLGAKAIGEIFNISMVSFGFKSETYWTRGYRGRSVTDWRGKWDASGGGVLMMNFSHYIDLVRHLTGLEVTRVSAEYGTYGQHSGIEVEDTLNATLMFNNGAIGGINTSTIAYGSSGSHVSLLGSQGQIVLVSEPMKVFTVRDDVGLSPNEWNEFPAKKDIGLSFYRDMVKDFIDAVIEDRPAPISGEEGLKCLQVVLSTYQAGREGGIVEIS